MPDATPQRSPASRMRPRSPADAIELDTETVAAAARRDALDSALRLLAVWAVRVARVQAAEAATDRQQFPDVTKQTHGAQEEDR